MPDLFLGVDAGTSSAKICAYGRRGELRARSRSEVPVIMPSPRWAEIDLEGYWEAIRKAIAEVVKEAGPVSSVGLATTCPTTVLLDEQLRPLRPGITYLDRRSEPQLGAAVEALGGAEAFAARTGNRPSSSTAWAANLAWVRQHEPAVWERTRHVGMLGTYIGWRLTGKVAVDWTQASYSGLFSAAQRAQGWQVELARAWGLDLARLPPIRPPYEALGTVSAQAARETGLPRGVPVAVGAADTAAASLAVGLREAGQTFESAGTSGVITFCLDRPDFDSTLMNRCHVLPDRWLAHGAMSTLGGTFSWLCHQIWPEVKSLAELEQIAAESVPGANGLVFLPYLAGERSPIWDAQASGAWVGLRLETCRADMARAAFEGVAFALRQILRRGQGRWGPAPARLLCVGGGARSRFWTQMKADVLNVDYAMSATPDASALGAALLGAVAAGRFTGPDDPALPTIRPPETDTIKPGPADRRMAYDRAFRVFESLYPALSQAMHDLAT